MSNLILSNKADVKSKICVIISSKLYSKAKEKGSYYITDKKTIQEDNFAFKGIFLLFIVTKQQF